MSDTSNESKPDVQTQSSPEQLAERVTFLERQLIELQQQIINWQRIRMPLRSFLDSSPSSLLRKERCARCGKSLPLGNLPCYGHDCEYILRAGPAVIA